MQALLPSRRAVIAMTLTIATLANAPVALAQQPSLDAIVGKWEADDGTVRLDMFKAGAEYQAHSPDRPLPVKKVPVRRHPRRRQWFA